MSVIELVIIGLVLFAVIVMYTCMLDDINIVYKRLAKIEIILKMKSYHSRTRLDDIEIILANLPENRTKEAQVLLDRAKILLEEK